LLFLFYFVSGIVESILLSLSSASEPELDNFSAFDDGRFLLFVLFYLFYFLGELGDYLGGSNRFLLLAYIYYLPSAPRPLLSRSRYLREPSLAFLCKSALLSDY